MTAREMVMILSLLTVGCIPVPTPPHGLGVVLDEKAFEALPTDGLSGNRHPGE